MRLLSVAFGLGLLMAAPVVARPVDFAVEPARGGTLVVPLAGEVDLASRTAMLDAPSRAALASALAAAKFDYKAGTTLSLRGLGGYDRILLVGTAENRAKPSTPRDYGGRAGAETMGDAAPVSVIAPQAADEIALGAVLGSYRFDRYKSKPGDAPAPLTLVTPDAADARARYEAGAAPLARAVAFARDLVTEPANAVYPESFVERVRAEAQGLVGVTIEALDVAAMEKLGMGALVGVGQGSRRPPRLLVVRYQGAGTATPIALIGKGITFDTGGISIKPGLGMWQMKYDMAGAAAVTGAALSLARSRAPVNVVAIAALAENMPGGGAQRPGDVVRTMSGKTIEVINTDAEGRLVLADAIDYALARIKPGLIIDVATLTGSARAALDDDYAALFARDDALAQRLTAAGEATGERLWRMPLHPDYAETMKSDIADIKNSAEGANAGAGLGAHFIGHFVPEAQPWAHLDIAGMAWASAAQPVTPKGATAFGVRLLDRFVREEFGRR